MATSRKTKKITTCSARGRNVARKRLVMRRDKRGLEAGQVLMSCEDPALAALVVEVQAAGGVAIGAYHEPLAGRPLLLAAMPHAAIQPTPFQRDLSPTHTKRLATKIEEAGVFLDPLIVVRGEGGGFWTPNGRHRLAAAKVLGLRQITALVSPDESLAFCILALNTEKAHNLKDRSLEVIRMARELGRRQPRAKESAFTAEFEAPELLTLGIIYERNSRFAGGAYSPFLKKIDRFSDRTLTVALRDRTGYAHRLEQIDAGVKRIILALQARGFRSPYLRSYVVARINPVHFHGSQKSRTQPTMSLAEGLTRMQAAARNFDLESVRSGDLALAAALSGTDG